MAAGSLGLVVASTLAWTAAWAGGSSTARAEESCVACHRELRDPRLRSPVTDLAASVHGDQDVGCSNCHGGNPEVHTVAAHDRSMGFRSRIEAAAMPETCGSCHSDPNRFRDEPDLPTDQLDRYLSSVHGKAFQAGNSNAAACWDCHGHHLVLRPDDPRSTVYPGNVADTCGHCHENPAIMAGSGLPTDEARQWRRSVHGQAFARWIAAGGPEETEEGEEHPPTCNDCHGEHDVEHGEAAVSACEGCHEDAWEAFRASPHEEAFANKGFLPCVGCHGSHEIQPADASLMGVDRDAACRRCHRAGQEMAGKIRRLAQAQASAERQAAEARRSLEGEENLSADERELLHALREHSHHLRIAIHTLDEDRIVPATQELERTAAAIMERAPKVVQRDERKDRLRVVVIGGTASLVVALLGLVLWVKRQRRS